jgi:ATP phosphoribosyltransferase regulatory subunit
MTIDKENEALLPSGLYDLLPPLAEQEVDTARALTNVFAGFGYERVKPPLVEFETTLTGAYENGGGSLSGQMFQLMDPLSQRMMAIRTDITLQVARIAETRLRERSRPLRLSYSGDVLRVRSSQLRPERLFAQAGVELIGSAEVSADVEIVVLAIEALAAAGILSPTIDLNSPALVAHLLKNIDINESVIVPLRNALDRKDSAHVRDITAAHAEAFGKSADLLDELVNAVGSVENVLPKLHGLDLPEMAAAEVDRLEAVVAGVRSAGSEVSITVDPVEYRGFEYHTGISFTVFVAGVRGELGRGGRYITSAGEAATGFSLYLDSIMRALPVIKTVPKLYIPYGTSFGVASQMRSESWTAIIGLEPEKSVKEEAIRLKCSHYWYNEETIPLNDLDGGKPTEK